MDILIQKGTIVRIPKLARVKLEYEEVDSVQRTGHRPRDEIVRAATDLSADLLVISTQERTGAMHFLVGSDAEHIIEHAQCPTLVVR